QQFIYYDSSGLICPFAFAKAKRAVSRDGREPRRKFLRIFNGRQRLECQQQRILRDVFGVFAADDSLSRADDSRPIAQHKFIKRLQVADDRGDNQRFVRWVNAQLSHPSLRLLVIESSYAEKVSGERGGSSNWREPSLIFRWD